MNFFGRQRTRSPGDTVKVLRETIARLDVMAPGEARKRVSVLSKRIVSYGYPVWRFVSRHNMVGDRGAGDGSRMATEPVYTNELLRRSPSRHIHLVL
jgi:hypothetical protein